MESSACVWLTSGSNDSGTGKLQGYCRLHLHSSAPLAYVLVQSKFHNGSGALQSDNGLHYSANDESRFATPVFAGDVHVVESHLDPFAVFISEHPS